MYSKSQKEELILCYFSILRELYDWNFQTYDVVIHDDISNTGVKEMHNKILKTLVLKDDSKVTSIIQELVAKDQLAINSGRYSSSGKKHWNDIIEILEEQREQCKQLSAKLTYQLDLGINEILNFDYNLVLLNLITNGVPLEKLRILYPKKLKKLMDTGLTDGEKIVGFNEFHYLYYKFNEYLKNEVVTSLVESERLSLFSNCKDYEKAIISIIARDKIIIEKGIDYYSVTEGTIDNWERKLSEIVVNIDDKILECAKITKLKPSQIKLIIQQLKQKGLVWEYKNFTYSVVHEIVLGVVPRPPNDFTVEKVKDFDLNSIPETKLEDIPYNKEPKQRQAQSNQLDKKLILFIKHYIQGFCITTKFTERPTQKKIEKLLLLLEKDFAKYGWLEEKDILNIFANEFELIIESEKTNNTKWRKLGKMFLNGLDKLQYFPK